MTMPERRHTLTPQEGGFSQWFWPHGLLLLSLGVLAIPLALWAAFWLRTPWNLLLVAAIGGALWALSRGANDVPLELTTRHELRATALWAFLPLALMCLGSGIGGWGIQTEDWNKHNSILADLVRSEWPVRYSSVSGVVHLTYYTAFYLPAALVGKVFGWTAALAMHQLGALVMMGLLASWLAWIAGPRAPWVGVLFAAFGGMDYLAAKVIGAWQGKPFQLGPFSLEWWEKPVAWWGYYAHATELFWVPHAALAGWLGCAILLRGVSPLDTQRNGIRAFISPQNWRDVSFDLVMCALLPLWNPWAWLGCLPFLGLRIAQQIRFKRKMVAWPWLFLLGLWGMQFGYLMSRVALPPGVIGGRGYHLTFTAPEFIRLLGPLYFTVWLGFCLVEFGFFAFLCWLLWRSAKATSPLAPFLTVSVITLALFPLFHNGLYNDLMRSAVAPLVVVCLACASALATPVAGRARIIKVMLVLALCVGGLHSVQYAINVVHDKKHNGLIHLPQLKKTPSVYALYVHDHRPQLLTQYIGPDDSLWARLFLKP